METRQQTLVSGTFPIVAYPNEDFFGMLARGGGVQYYKAFDKSEEHKFDKKIILFNGHIPDVPTKWLDWHWDVYFNIHPLKELPPNGKRGTEADVKSVACVFGEYDMDKGWTQEKIDAISPTPSLVVFSG